jgi:exopolyphosphatase / guanosine-5'-triphosphate,3'-diphosphate pyrophosphatase
LTAYLATPNLGSPVYAALDLGTNNCRLLIAKPAGRGFRVIDAFSRIVRLGQGLTQSGRLSEEAIERTLSALAVCRDKMRARHVSRARLIATEACRAASNGEAFLQRVREEIGLEFEIIDRRTEAHLASAGCSELADPAAGSILLFDIGGGSTEIVLLGRQGGDGWTVRAWESMRLGVVTLAETFGGIDVDEASYQSMVDYVDGQMADFGMQVSHHRACSRFHLLGTSGTVTTVAGVHLNLPRYERRAVDGLWLGNADVETAMAKMRVMSYAERVAHPCIGKERADLVLPGCAIFDAIRGRFPASRLRVGDRGLREGMLAQLMREDRLA